MSEPKNPSTNATEHVKLATAYVAIQRKLKMRNVCELATQTGDFKPSTIEHAAYHRTYVSPELENKILGALEKVNGSALPEWSIVEQIGRTYFVDVSHERSYPVADSLLKSGKFPSVRQLSLFVGQQTGFKVLHMSLPNKKSVPLYVYNFLEELDKLPAQEIENLRIQYADANQRTYLLKIKAGLANPEPKSELVDMPKKHLEQIVEGIVVRTLDKLLPELLPGLIGKDRKLLYDRLGIHMLSEVQKIRKELGLMDEA